MFRLIAVIILGSDYSCIMMRQPVLIVGGFAGSRHGAGQEPEMIRELSEFEVKALHYELLMKDIISTAEKLPPFPDIAWKVVALIKKAAPVNEIEAVIKYDQAISLRILSLSRSVYFSRRSGVDSIKDAVLVLGSRRLVQVIMVACAARYFQGEKGGYDEGQAELWKHSVSAAMAAEKIAQRFKHRKLLSVYTAALLHDVGKTVLDLYARIYLHTSLGQLREEGSRIIESERKSLGIDHQELGEIIAKRWKLPPEIIAAIGRHHAPQQAPEEHRDIVGIVYAANRIAESIAVKEGEIDSLYPDYDPVFKELTISNAMTEEIKAEVAKELSDVMQFLSDRW